MDYKHTIDILSENIKELETIVLGFGNRQKIPVIDIDLLLDKTRNFYDVLLLLRQNIHSSATAQDVLTEQKKENEATASGPELKEEEPVFTNDTENIQKEEAEVKKEVSKIQAEPIREEREDKGSEPKIVSDRFRKQPSSIHDTFSKSKQYSDLSSKLQSKPITDISNAIGLNDKFAFIHELFRGDVKKYESTISVLNAATNFNEAFNYLIENFDWDMDSGQVQKLLDLIRRKFITGKNE